MGFFSRNRDKTRLVNEIIEFAELGGSYYIISSTVGTRGRHASVWVHRESGAKDRYAFRDHGYDYLSYEGMVELFNTLAKKVRGHVEISWEELGEVSAFSSKGFVSSPKAITLYSYEEWKYRQEKKEQEKMREAKYKKTF